MFTIHCYNDVKNTKPKCDGNCQGKFSSKSKKKIFMKKNGREAGWRRRNSWQKSEFMSLDREKENFVFLQEVTMKIYPEMGKLFWNIYEGFYWVWKVGEEGGLINVIGAGN